MQKTSLCFTLSLGLDLQNILVLFEDLYKKLALVLVLLKARIITLLKWACHLL